MKKILTFSAILLVILSSFSFAEEKDDKNQKKSDRPYQNILVLGAIVPMDTEQGLTSPVIIFDHESYEHYLDGTLNISLRTSSLELGMTHSLSPVFAFEYKLLGEVLSAGDPTALYDLGIRLREKTFYTTNMGVAVSGHLFPEGPIQLEVEGIQRKFISRGNKDTEAGYDYPSDFNQSEIHFIVSKKGLLGEKGAKLSLDIGFGSRSDWENWEFESNAGETEKFSIQTLNWEQPLTWNEKSKSAINLTLGNGDDLDIFSGFGVGGRGGELKVRGYFRNEFRAKRAAVLNLSHDQTLGDNNHIVSVFADAAYFQEQDNEYLSSVPHSRTIAGVGLGYRINIESLGGLPVILQYGHGLNPPDDLKTKTRQEIMAIIALGW